jgi:hypothetical protein
MKVAGVAFVCAITTGCANLDAVFHTFSIQRPIGESSDSVSIDAKQRVVLSGKISETEVRKGTNGTADVRVTVERPVVCAEPSPDAISAIAQSLSGKANISDVKALELAFGQTESSAYIGLRTQTIQLLRDGMYRICEGYMSGALDKASFNELQRRYQNLMMGLLAVEQLTGAVVAPQLALTSAVAKAAASPGSSEMKNRLNDYASAKVATEAATKELQAAQGAAKTQKDVAANAAADKKDEENKKLATAEAAVTEKAGKKHAAEIVETYLKDSLDAVTPGTQAAATAATANWQLLGLAKPNGDFAAVSKGVFDIVNLIVNDSFRSEDCSNTIRELASKASLTAGERAALDSCLGKVQKLNEQVQQVNKINQTQAELAKETDQGKKSRLLQQLDGDVKTLRMLQ